MIFYKSSKHVHFNNYYLVDDRDTELELDMVIGFESTLPYAFANWAVLSKADNPILHFVIDSYLEFMRSGGRAAQPKSAYVGRHSFTEAIVGFADAFTVERDVALSFHKFDDGKAHVVTFYLQEQEINLLSEIKKEDVINVLVVPLPDFHDLVRRKRPHLMRTQSISV